MVFLSIKNGLWLTKPTPICQGGKEAFGQKKALHLFVFTTVNINFLPFCRLDLLSFLFLEACELSLVRSVSVWGQESGPEASLCPAVLGDVEPC